MYVYFVGIVDVEVIEIFQIYENSTIYVHIRPGETAVCAFSRPAEIEFFYLGLDGK